MRADRVLPEYEPERQLAAPLNDLIPPPQTIQRRAWECACELAAEHSNTINDEARWHWLQHMACRGYERITWQQAAQLFRLHRLVRARLAGEADHA